MVDVSSYTHQTRVPKLLATLIWCLSQKATYKSTAQYLGSKNQHFKARSGEETFRKSTRADLSLSRPRGPNLPRGADNPLQRISLLLHYHPTSTLFKTTSEFVIQRWKSLLLATICYPNNSYVVQTVLNVQESLLKNGTRCKTYTLLPPTCQD